MADDSGEWGVEIQDGGRTMVEGPFSEGVARYEFDRWKSFGYNTTAVMYRPDPDSPWERVE